MIQWLEKEYRKYFPKQLKGKSKYINALNGLSGIEIGGPSEIFSTKGLLPIYDSIHTLDGCNFSSSTVWEGAIKDGQHYQYALRKKKGYQYIAEGSSLPMINSHTYDFVLSCHNLEHLANPLKAINEWKRITSAKGYLLIVLPHKDKTFDRHRPVTSLQHLLADFALDTPETDSTHFKEIEDLHDISLDTALQDKAQLQQRLKHNLHNRCAHHHVFNTPLVAQMADVAALKIVALDVMYHNIFLLAQKTTEQPDNSYFLSSSYPLYAAGSHYPSDVMVAP
jgi:SAM-dependent methyltransferase